MIKFNDIIFLKSKPLAWDEICLDQDFIETYKLEQTMFNLTFNLVARYNKILVITKYDNVFQMDVSSRKMEILPGEQR